MMHVRKAVEKIAGTAVVALFLVQPLIVLPTAEAAAAAAASKAVFNLHDRSTTTHNHASLLQHTQSCLRAFVSAAGSRGISCRYCSARCWHRHRAEHYGYLSALPTLQRPAVVLDPSCRLFFSRGTGTAGEMEWGEDGRGLSRKAEAVVFEFQSDEATCDAVARNGKLHRLLRLRGFLIEESTASQPERRLLLGENEVATMTDLNFTVVHKKNDDSCQLEHGGGDEDALSYSSYECLQLGLGNRLWAVGGKVGDEQEARTESYQSEDVAKQETAPPADYRSLRQAIESMVPIVSTIEISSKSFAPGRRRLQINGNQRQRRRKLSMSSLPLRYLDSAQHSLRRIITRVRAARTLAKTTDPATFCSGQCDKQERRAENKSYGQRQRGDSTHINPLLRIGVGKLLSRNDCEAMVAELRGITAKRWLPWDGDVGNDDSSSTVTAISLDQLPESRARWDQAVGSAVRARIARTYGVHDTCVVMAEAEHMFFCRVESPHPPQSCHKQQHQQHQQVSADNTETQQWKTTVEGTGAVKVRNGVQQPTAAAMSDPSATTTTTFRRSASLISFTVALGEVQQQWTVCFEKRGQCVRLSEQGTGVIFSGKLRHATVPMSMFQPWQRHQPTTTTTTARLASERSELPKEHVLQQPSSQSSSGILLRGFASIRGVNNLSPSFSRVGETVTMGWQWGNPIWNLDAPWITDRDILDRAWMATGGATVSNATSSSRTAATGTAKSIATAATATATTNSTSQNRVHFKYMNVSPPETEVEGVAVSTTGRAPAFAPLPQLPQYQQPTLNRMNSSLAHRYYRQIGPDAVGGSGGMDFPTVDQQGRPVIDLIPRQTALHWIPGREGRGEITISAVLRRRLPWQRRRHVGKAGLSLDAGSSPRMDAALRELFGGGEGEVEGEVLTQTEAQRQQQRQALRWSREQQQQQQQTREQQKPREHQQQRLVRVPVPPIKYVFVDPRYRGLRLGRRLFLEAMCLLARRGFRFALIVVEDNGSGGLFGFYEEMGFVRADKQLGIARAMIAPIPPPACILER